MNGLTSRRPHDAGKASGRTARSILVPIVCQLIVGSAMARDTPFRCGSKIIYTGMTRVDVFEYCGAPTSESTELREVRSNKNRVLGTTEINRWTYESYSATRVLVFLDDKLQSIERL